MPYLLLDVASLMTGLAIFTVGFATGWLSHRDWTTKLPPPTLLKKAPYFRNRRHQKSHRPRR
jgi:hypothetical protein